ncbi:hypothetical protein C0989_011285 [Termitomyces sp. Mn162]|nr:hypothetical protein C0989_011285 [Termitomyces sp. Mn162]
MSRNNVRGPTSALTEFLKASGITATSIAAHRQNEEAEEPVAGPSGTRDSENEEDENGEMGHAEEDEAVPRQRPKRQGRASISTAYDSDNLDGEQEEKSPPAKKRKLTKAAEAKLKAKEKAKAKKNKKNEDSDNEQEDPYRALASSWGGKAASPAKPVIGNFEDCAKCNVQFTVLITKHIDDVEALGDIGAMNMDAISKALSKNRALYATPKNAHLFYNATNSTLTLYDATNLPSPALETLVYLNPNITSLRLDFCGHMNDKVMSIMCSSLASLIHLELLGPFLVRSPIWVTFFKSHPSLETFKITQSPRFDIEAMLALKKYCASTLTELRLREVGAMNDAFLDAIGSLKKVEKLDIGDPGKANECTAEALQGVLFALSGTLRVLDVSRHEQVTDSVLKEGLAGTRHMDELVARNTTLLTDMGVAEFFKTWKNQPLRRIDFGRNHDLGSAALVALIEHSGERLEELGINGWGDVETGALKMLGRLGGELRRLDVGWVREVDDFVVKGWMEGNAEEDVESKRTKGRKEEVTRSAGCTRLCEVKVWGCNKITARCPRKVSIFGLVEAQADGCFL